MTAPRQALWRPLSEEISDPLVAGLFERFVETVSGFHADLEVSTSRADLRFLFGDIFVCRVAPYRELFHVQIGENPAWEARVRRADDLPEALDHALGRFLAVYSAAYAR